MGKDKEDFKKLVKRKGPIKAPDNLEAVYNDHGGFIGRRPIKKIEMELSKFVMVRNNPYKIEEKTLDLRKLGITDMDDITNLEEVRGVENLLLSENNITQIKGLDHLIDLKTLDLDDNKLTKISGLENLINLKVLRLRNNAITKLEGLGSLSNLEDIDINFNKIPEKILNLLYYNETYTPMQAAQNLVKHCAQDK